MRHRENFTENHREFNKGARRVPLSSAENYYTILLEGEDMDMFHRFILRHEEQFFEELDVIKVWLERIGNKIGVKNHLFRFEAYQGWDARALPPATKFLETDLNLRLYCMIVDRKNIILFDGGLKTARTAQECKNVRPHFLMANRLSKVIHHLMIVNETKVFHNGS